MKILIIAILLVLLATPAYAKWTGNRVGNFTYWNNYETGETTTCNQVGSFTYCS